MRNGWVTSRIGICHDCGERWEDERNNKSIIEHARKYGHYVTVNTVRAYHYDGRKMSTKREERTP